MASLKRWLDRRRNPWRAVFHNAYQTWKREKGSKRLYDYAELPAGAVVWDVGGYQGSWTDMILAAQPQVLVHVFEPHPTFARQLREKYATDARVQIHECALGAKDGTLTLSDAGDASSARVDHGKVFNASIRGLEAFLLETPSPRVDLMKMNIEGDEYDLLPAMINSGFISNIKRLQVQFHLFDPKMITARDRIQSELQKTHECAWAFPFVWEEWQR